MSHDRLIGKLLKSGLYRVDPDGAIWTRRVKKAKFRTYDGWRRAEFVKPGEGYLLVYFEKKALRAHRIVFMHWHGELVGDLEINHKNGIKGDNHPDNLEQISQSENGKHAYRLGLNPGAGRGSKNANAKITEEAVREIFRLSAQGLSQAKIAMRFGVSPGNVNNILCRRAWAHVSLGTH